MGFRNILIYLLAGALALPAQQAVSAEPAKPDPLLTPAAEPATPLPPGPLKINVTAGADAHNSIRERTAVAPAVEVKDAEDKPVAGAEVVFQLPLSGPGGSFNGWLRTQTVRTDEAGKAVVKGYAPNTEAGSFAVKATVTLGSMSGTAVINQVNEGTVAPLVDTPPPVAAAPTTVKRPIPWKLVGPAIAAVAVIVIAVAIRAGR